MKAVKQKFIKIIAVIMLVALAAPHAVFAGAGTMGFSGGISEGLRMPTIIDRLQNPALNGRRNIAGEYAYSEVVFITGEPMEFTGDLFISQGGGVTDDPLGSFTFSNIVDAMGEDGESFLDRSIQFNVSWRRENNQVIKNYSLNSWAESILTPYVDLVLDEEQSHFVISIIEDHNPGIVFYRGNFTKRAVFINLDLSDDDFEYTHILEASGVIYGFDSPFSSTETQSIDAWVFTPTWQMSYQVRPSVSVTTSLMYQPTAPTAISFAGNYMHFMENRSIAAYDIFIVPQPFFHIPTSGSISVDSRQTFEQLIAPDMTFLRGHFAEQDISRLFAQGILTGPPTHFQPAQAMTRGEFITALVRSLRLEVITIQPARMFDRTTRIVFPDVLSERPEYPYIMAAYRAGLAYGRADGNFHIDAPITREEVVATLIRGLGLENVAQHFTPVTAFADSTQISAWATRDLAAALELGLIAGDANGNFRPRDIITKAEASAFINRFIDYMREDLVADYSQRMVNFVAIITIC